MCHGVTQNVTSEATVPPGSLLQPSSLGGERRARKSWPVLGSPRPVVARPRLDAGLPAFRRRSRRTCRLPFCDGDEEALVQRTSDLRLWYTNALYTWSFTVSFSYVMMRFSISFL